MNPIKDIKLPNPNPKVWGNWQLDTDTWTLIFRNGRIVYEVDLLSIDSSAQMLHWIFHLCGIKRWMEPKDCADLIEAFRNIFNPQAYLCPWGADERVEPQQFLTVRYAK